MFSIEKLIHRVGDAREAEAVLLQHFVAKQGRKLRDDRYARMEFMVKWSPVFRRHAASRLAN